MIKCFFICIAGVNTLIISSEKMNCELKKQLKEDDSSFCKQDLHYNICA